MIADVGDVKFLTNYVFPTVMDGSGAQFHRRLSVWAYCLLNDIEYIHTPLKSVEHNHGKDSDWETRWESFFNLGHGHTLLDEKAGWFTRHHGEVFHVTQLIPWFNKNGVDLYDKVRDRFFEKYNLTQKPELYFDDDFINVAVHVRRGDLVSKPRRFSIAGLPDEYYIKVMHDINEEYESLGKNCKFYVYTQDRSSKRGIRRKSKEGLFDNFEKLDLNLEMVIDGCPFSDIHHMLKSDVLISSKSHFSYIPSLFTSGRVVHCEDKNQSGSAKTYWDIRDRDGNKIENGE